MNHVLKHNIVRETLQLQSRLKVGKADDGRDTDEDITKSRCNLDDGRETQADPN